MPEHRSFVPISRLPSSFGTLVPIILISGLGLVLGLIAALFPPSFGFKLGAVLLIALALLAAGLGQSERPVSVSGLRRLWLLYIFNLGAVPAYLALQLKPLPDLAIGRLLFWACTMWACYSLVRSKQLRKAAVEFLKTGKYFLIFFALFVTWSLICSFIGERPLTSLTYVAKLWFSAGVVFTVSLVLFRNANDVRRTFAVIALSGGVAGALALVEKWVGHNLFVGFMPTDQESIETFGWIIEEKSRGGVYRAASVFTHPLAFAEFLNITLPLSLHLIFTSKRVLSRTLWLVVLLAALAGLYVSNTRSAYAVIAVSCGTYVALSAIQMVRQRRSPSRAFFGVSVMVLLVAAVVAAAPAAYLLASGRTAEESGSSEARVIMLSKGLAAIEDSPIAGYGPGTAAGVIGPIKQGFGITIDNYYLSVLLETGLPGFVLWVLAMAMPLWAAFNCAVRTDSRNANVATALCASLLGFMAQRAVLSLTGNMDVIYLLMACVFVVVSVEYDQPRD